MNDYIKGIVFTTNKNITSDRFTDFYGEDIANISDNIYVKWTHHLNHGDLENSVKYDSKYLFTIIKRDDGTIEMWNGSIPKELEFTQKDIRIKGTQYFKTIKDSKGANMNIKDFNKLKAKAKKNNMSLADAYKVNDVDWDFLHKIRNYPQEKVLEAVKKSVNSNLYKEIKDRFAWASIGEWTTKVEKEKILKHLNDSKKDSIKDDWRNAMEQFYNVVRQYYKNDEASANVVTNELKKLYKQHKGEQDWEDAWKKLQSNMGALIGKKVALDSIKKTKDASKNVHIIRITDDTYLSSSKELYNAMMKLQKAYDKKDSNWERLKEEKYIIKGQGNLEGRFQMGINGGKVLINHYGSNGHVMSQYWNKDDSLSSLNEWVRKELESTKNEKDIKNIKLSDLKFLYFLYGSGESNDRNITKWNNVKIESSSQINQLKNDILKADNNHKGNGYDKTDLYVVFSIDGKKYKSKIERIDIGDGENAMREYFKRYFEPDKALNVAYRYLTNYGVSNSNSLVRKLDSIKDDEQSEQFKRLYNENINAFKKTFNKEPSDEELKNIRQITLGQMAFIKAYHNSRNDSIKDDTIPASGGVSYYKKDENKVLSLVRQYGFNNFANHNTPNQNGLCYLWVVINGNKELFEKYKQLEKEVNKIKSNDSIKDAKKWFSFYWHNNFKNAIDKIKEDAFANHIQVSIANTNKSDIQKMTFEAEEGKLNQFINKYINHFANRNGTIIFKDSIKDVNPRAEESKADFIARFMNETKSEYPNEKQRYAVANSYWERKGRDSIRDGGSVEVIGVDSKVGNTYVLKVKLQSGTPAYLVTSNYNGEKIHTTGGTIEFNREQAKQLAKNFETIDKLNNKYGEVEGYKRYMAGKKDSINDSTELSAKTIESLEEMIKHYQKNHPNMTYGDVEKRNGLYRVKVDLNDSIKDGRYPSTTRRQFSNADIDEKGSYLGTTDWGTPKGNMYIYKENGKIIAECHNDQDWYPHGKHSFDSVYALNKWLNDGNLNDSIHDDYSSFLGNYGFDYMKGSGDYETWYLKYEDEDFNKLVNRMRAEYPSMIISASPSQKTIYIQKSKYGVKDSIHDSKIYIVYKKDINTERILDDMGFFDTYMDALRESNRLNKSNTDKNVYYSVSSRLDDSIHDEDIEELSKEEQQAIDDYKKAIAGTTDVKLLELYSHILREEIEHLRELNEAKTEDSVKDEKIYSILIRKNGHTLVAKYTTKEEGDKIYQHFKNKYPNDEITISYDYMWGDSIKDRNLANDSLRVGQIVHLDQTKISKKLDEDVLNDDYEIVGFYYNQQLVKEDIAPESHRDFAGIKIKGKKSGVSFDVNRFQLKDSIKNAVKYKKRG